MPRSGRTARRLAAGPTLLLAAEVSGEIADAESAEWLVPIFSECDRFKPFAHFTG